MKTKTVIGVVASLFVASFGMAILAADHERPGQIKHSDHDHDDGDDQRIAGFNYARSQGITLNFNKKDKELVGLVTRTRSAAATTVIRRRPSRDPYVPCALKQINNAVISPAARHSGHRFSCCNSRYVTSRPGKTANPRD
jgi:hypothetical protein